MIEIDDRTAEILVEVPSKHALKIRRRRLCCGVAMRWTKSS